jgi:peptidoglycan hydrolase-like protein with peptidoglycan-binding domain
MSDIRSLLENLDRIDEAQNHEFLNTIVNRYAVPGMSLDDLAAMEKAAYETDPPRGNNIFSRTLNRLLTPSYRARYVLAHASDKLDLPGLYNVRGNFVYLNDEGEAASAGGANRREAEALAAVNLLPPEKAERFNITITQPAAQTDPADGQAATAAQTDPADGQAATAAQTDPADGQAATAAATPTATTSAVKPAAAPAAAPLEPVDPATTSASSMETWADSNPTGGLMRARNQREVITDLQTFLTNTLGLDTGGTDGRYGPKTREAVTRFQRAVTGLDVDGDAGVQTINKIKELRADVAEIRRLLSNVRESALPVTFTSKIGKLLEALSDPEKQQLQQLVNKYNNFRQQFPQFERELFARAARVPDITVTYLDNQGNDTGVNVQSGNQAVDTIAQRANAAINRADAAGQFDPAVPAREIYVAVDGALTDEEGVQSGLQKIANKAQWDLVDRAAKSAYGEDIMQLINGDMQVEADRVRYVYPELRRIGVPHTVEVNRIRQLANVNFNNDVAPYYDAQGRFPPQGGTISNAAAPAAAAAAATTPAPSATSAAPPSTVAVGDIASTEQSNTLKALNPNSYPMAGEPLDQADVDALNNSTAQPPARGVNSALVRNSINYDDLSYIKDKLGKIL